MANIHQLPQEVLRNTSDYLYRRDLLRFSLVSKPIRTVVEPSLYREIDLSWNPQARRSRKHDAPVHRLLRSIISRPDLAQHIRDLRFRGEKRSFGPQERRDTRKPLPVGSPRSLWKSYQKSDLTSAEMTGMESLIRSLKLPAEERWLEGLRQGWVDVFVALVISRASNLRDLGLNSDFQRETDLIGILIKEAVSRSPKLCFAALESITFGIDIEYNRDVVNHDVDLNQILPVFSIPSVKSLCMALPAKEITWPKDQVPTSSLTSLTLHHSQLSEEMLGQLLRCTPSLRSLDYRSWYNIESNGRPNREFEELLDCVKLSASLAHVQETLEDLRICARFIAPQEMFPEDETHRPMKGNLDSLHKFPHLRNLDIPIVVLLGWTPHHDDDDSLSPKLRDLFPPSLRNLVLTDDLQEMGQDEWYYPEVIQLFQEALEDQDKDKGGLANLKGIMLRLNSASRSWYGDGRAKLVPICERAGIHCKFWFKAGQYPCC